MKMRFALAALLLTSTSAFAADLAPRAAEPVAPIVAPVYSWTGFYAGLHAGAVFGNAKVTNPGFDRETFRNTGFIGGVHAGYNEQFDNNIVIGLEGDIDYTSLSKSKQFIGGSNKFKSDFQGSIRARAGYAMDQFLPYITGGVAFADEKLRSTDVDFGSLSSSKTVAGWTAGGGVEYAVDPNWIVRGEVRYTDFGKQNFNFAGDRLKVRFDEVTTELGVSYKF